VAAEIVLTDVDGQEAYPANEGGALVTHVLLFFVPASGGVSLIAGIDDETYGDVSSTGRLEMAVR